MTHKFLEHLTSRKDVLDAVQLWPPVILHVCHKHLQDRELVLAAVTRCGDLLQFIQCVYVMDEEIMDEEITVIHYNQDREVVLAAVKQSGRALKYAHDSLQKDKDVVLAAVHQAGSAIQFAAHCFQYEDADVLKAAALQMGLYIDPKEFGLCTDKAYVRKVVSMCGFALRFASSEFKRDKDVVLAAVQRWGWALQHAHITFWYDKEVVLAAVQQCGLCYEIISGHFPYWDRGVMLAAVQQHGWSIEHFRPEYGMDEEFALLAIENCPLAYHFIPLYARIKNKLLKATFDRCFFQKLVQHGIIQQTFC